MHTGEPEPSSTCPVASASRISHPAKDHHIVGVLIRGKHEFPAWIELETSRNLTLGGYTLNLR